MLVSRELRKKNIAEYLLYMWQVEDLLRANELSLEKIKSLVVEPYGLPAEVADELLDWYGTIKVIGNVRSPSSHNPLSLSMPLYLLSWDPCILSLSFSWFPYT